jgi:hypothetical protein
VTKIPEQIFVGTPFDVSLSVFNFGKKPVTLRLFEDRTFVCCLRPRAHARGLTWSCTWK